MYIAIMKLFKTLKLIKYYKYLYIIISQLLISTKQYSPFTNIIHSSTAATITMLFTETVRSYN